MVLSLRERNRERAREEILNAGARLFGDSGFEETTVDAIAAEAGVSRRTFFRYFATKQDLALALEDLDRQTFMLLLASRPIAETPLEALCGSLLETMSLFDDAAHRAAAERIMESQRLIQSSPTLRAAYLYREDAREAEAARILADRLGIDGDTDYRPRLWVALAGAAMRVALSSLVRSYRPGEPISATTVLREVFAASGLLDGNAGT